MVTTLWLKQPTCFCSVYTLSHHFTFLILSYFYTTSILLSIFVPMQAGTHIYISQPGGLIIEGGVMSSEYGTIPTLGQLHVPQPHTTMMWESARPQIKSKIKLSHLQDESCTCRHIHHKHRERLRPLQINYLFLIPPPVFRPHQLFSPTNLC